jgi:ubiquinone/menaquinone biosynthesis C-methylase UbiE
MTNLPHDAVAFMSSWYDVRTNAYIEWCYGEGREVAHDLARAAGAAPGLHVLDVGCNLGNMTFVLAREYGCYSVGVDASRAAIEVAQIRAQENPPPAPAVFHVADARAMPFDDGEFDGIVSKDTFVNIVGKPALSAELRRVLRGPDPASGRPGGRLAFTDWMAGNPEPTAAYHAWREFKKEEPFDKLSLDGYEQLLREAGFKIVDRQDRGEEFRQHVSRRYAAFRAADPAEMRRRFGIENHDYFVKRFGLTLDMLMAQDVIWGQITAEKQ